MRRRLAWSSPRPCRAMPPTTRWCCVPAFRCDEFRESKGKGFKIGTNAVRRAAYLRRLFPEATVIHFRGAADTRVAKLDRGDKQRLPDGGEVGPADALVMARSGLERIGMTSRIAHDFSVREMLPAVGQGIVAVECVENDWLTRARLAKIEDAQSRLCAEAEREVLWVLNGHCNSPIAGHATLAGNEMTLTASVLDETGGGFIEVSRQGAADRPRELGRAVGLELLDKGAAEIIARTRPEEIRRLVRDALPGCCAARRALRRGALLIRGPCCGNGSRLCDAALHAASLPDTVTAVELACCHPSSRAISSAMRRSARRSRRQSSRLIFCITIT